MPKIVFVPLTDEMIFDRPDMITGPITIYRPCISKKHDQLVSSKGALKESGVYLKGDLVNGLDVVYVDDKPIKKKQNKKYRGLSRGI